MGPFAPFLSPHSVVTSQTICLHYLKVNFENLQYSTWRSCLMYLEINILISSNHCTVRCAAVNKLSLGCHLITQYRTSGRMFDISFFFFIFEGGGGGCALMWMSRRLRGHFKNPLLLCSALRRNWILASLLRPCWRWCTPYSHSNSTGPTTLTVQFSLCLVKSDHSIVFLAFVPTFKMPFLPLLTLLNSEYQNQIEVPHDHPVLAVTWRI